MSKKVYEYKDETDWYLLRTGSEFARLSSFDGDYEGRIESLYPLFDLFDFLEDVTYSVHIVTYTSELKLLTFIIESLNDAYNRSLELIQHQGIYFISEGDNLYSAHIPKGGVSKESIFAQNQPSGLGDTILIATHNEGKAKEFRQMFQKMGISVESLNDYPDLPEVPENGVTFEENARLKAETIAELTGKMVLADDSGLKVDVLGGMPGVWSARFSGPDATDEKNNMKLLHELAMVFELKDRSAQFHTCLVVAAPNKESLVVEADWDGYIGFDAKGENGFGYDPLFLVGETGKTSAQLTSEEKNAISHRGQAVKKLMEVFPSWQQKQSL